MEKGSVEMSEIGPQPQPWDRIEKLLEEAAIRKSDCAIHIHTCPKIPRLLAINSPSEEKTQFQIHQDVHETNLPYLL
jgi:hypothetical protein